MVGWIARLKVIRSSRGKQVEEFFSSSLTLLRLSGFAIALLLLMLVL